MSRISNTEKYPVNPEIKDEDIVLGSKGIDKKTRNFKFSDIGEYVKNFFGKSNEEIPSFDSHVFGVTPEGKVIKIPVTEILGSEIIGEAFPSTIPIPEGFVIYVVSTPGVYTNFLDSSGNPLSVYENDLTAGNGGLVQLWGNNNVWEKHVIVIDDATVKPQTDDDIFNI